MNKIDSRFLNFNIIVKGRRSTPPENPKNGDQYIVTNNATGAFEGILKGSLVRYNGERWVVVSDGQELFDISTGEWLEYSSATSDWVSISFDNDETFGTALVRKVKYIIRAGDTNPGNVETGEYFLNTTTKKIHIGLAGNKWDNGTDIEIGNYLFKTNVNSGWALKYYDGVNFHDIYINNLHCLLIAENGYYDNDTRTLIIDTSDTEYQNILYYFNSINLYRLYPPKTTSSASGGGKNFYTETHTLTTTDISNQYFTLTYNVESGEEDNILCFVSGLFQPTITVLDSNQVFWGSTPLDGTLAEGDVVVVHYVKAAE